MFGFFSKKSNSDRIDLQQRFERCSAELRANDEQTQLAVGHSINLANSMFIQRFGSVDAFRRLRFTEKRKYAEQLNAAQSEMLKAQQREEALGFMLFKSWILTLAADDVELERQFSTELAFFSKKGDLSGAALVQRARQFLDSSAAKELFKKGDLG